MTQQIKPAPGRTIRRPEAGFSLLPEEGMLVDWNPYWDRALTEGDVVLIDDTPKGLGSKAKTGGES